MASAALSSSVSDSGLLGFPGCKKRAGLPGHSHALGFARFRDSSRFASWNHLVPGKQKKETIVRPPRCFVHRGGLKLFFKKFKNVTF